MGGCISKDIDDILENVDDSMFKLARAIDMQKGMIDCLVNLQGELDHSAVMRVYQMLRDLQENIQENVMTQMRSTLSCTCELLHKRHTINFKTVAYMEEEKSIINANIESFHHNSKQNKKSTSNPTNKIQDETSSLEESSPLLPKKGNRNDERIRKIDVNTIVAEQTENNVLVSHCRTTAHVVQSEITDKVDSTNKFLEDKDENQSYCYTEVNISNEEKLNSDCTKRKCKERIADLRVQLQEELQRNKQLEILVETLKRSLDDKEEHIKVVTLSLEKEKANASEQAKEVQLTLVTLQEELKKNKQLEDLVETLKCSLKNKEKQLQEVTIAIERLETEKANANEHAKEVQLSLIKLQEDLQKNKQLEITVQTLKLSFENKEEQLQEVTLSLDRMAKEKADANEHAKEVQLILDKTNEDLLKTQANLKHEQIKSEQTEAEVKEISINLREKEQLIQKAGEEVEALKQAKIKYETTAFDLRQIIISLEQRNKTLTEANELLAKRITEQNILRVQVYCPSQSGIMMEVEKEMMSLIQTKLENRTNEFKFVKCINIAEVNQSLPTLLLCINTSRLGTDVSSILQKFQANSKMAVIVFHHKDSHALPNESSSRVLIGQEFRQLGGIFDTAFLTGKGIYSCKLNEDNISKLILFILNLL